jgi:hypothetical protein
VLAAVDKLNRTSLEFGALMAVRDQLAVVPPPSDAPAKLVKALDQMSLIYYEIDRAILNYVTLDFDPPAETEDRKRLRKNMMLLQELAAGHTKTELSTLRGHCDEITTIYVRDLAPWFATVLDDSDVTALQTLFMTFVANFDDNILAAVTELVGWVTQRAEETLQLVREERYQEANERILAAEKESFDSRRTTLDGVNLLRELQSTFIAVA